MRRLLPATVIAALLLSGCASFSGGRCSAHEQHLVNDTLYFGSKRPVGVIKPAEWTDFLGSVVTPKFPDGLTTWQASGQWRSANGALIRETSYVLNFLHPESEAAESAVQAVVSEYKSRFQQEAVLRARSEACVSL